MSAKNSFYEGTNVIATVNFRADGVAFPPTTVHWTLRNETADKEVVPLTSVTPSDSVTIRTVLWHNLKCRPQPLSKREWLFVILLGLDGYYLASYLDFSSLKYIAAGLERVILFLYPTFVVLFSAAIFRRKINLIKLLALGLSYAGLILVFLDHLSAPSPHLWRGSALVLGSALVFAVFTMSSGVMVHRIGS